MSRKALIGQAGGRFITTPPQSKWTRHELWRASARRGGKSPTMSLLRIFFPKWAERRRIAKLARQVRPKAYEDAKALCAAVGPIAIARSYITGCAKIDCSLCATVAERLSPERVAKGYAESAYQADARAAAFKGALAGFAEYAEAQR